MRQIPIPRRWYDSITVLWVLFLLIGKTLFLPSCRSGESWHTQTLFFFDTLCELQIRGTQAEITQALTDVHRIFTDIEASFAPDSKDLTSDLVLHLYRRAVSIHRDSEGLLDITVGPLSRAWGFQEKTHRIPSTEEIQKLLQQTGMDRITISGDGLILQPGTMLDWGAIAKGYGVDLAAHALSELGIDSGLLNAGGDLYCWGKNPKGEDWRVGIKDPREAGYYGILSLSGSGAATTGDYQRYFLEGGKRYHHVFDPRTGYPARGKQSVTVVGPETLVCDALSTALFITEDADSILLKYPDYGAYIIDERGNLTVLGKKFNFRLTE